MKRIGLLSIVLIAALSAGCKNNNDRGASSQGSTAGTAGRSEPNQIPNRDRDFVRDTAVVNQAEIDLGRLATERGSTDSVKKFAQMMIDDHTKAIQSLRAAVSQYNLEVPSQVADKQRADRDSLAKKQGLDFDRDYMDHMVDGHEDFVSKLESRLDKASVNDFKARAKDREAGKTAGAEGQTTTVLPQQSDNAVTMSVNRWAAETYPIAVAHLDEARTVRDAVKKRTTN